MSDEHPDGMRAVVWRQHRGERVAALTVGAWSEGEAVQRASAYLKRRDYVAEVVGCSGGARLKVGVMGLRRYTVTFRVLGGPR